MSVFSFEDWRKWLNVRIYPEFSELCRCVLKRLEPQWHWFRAIRRLHKLTWLFPPQHGGRDLCVMNILSAFYYRHNGFILTTNVFSWSLIVELWWETAGGSFTCTLPSFCVVCPQSKETSAICGPLLSVFTLQDAWKSLRCPWIRESHLIHVISKPVVTW